MSMWGNVFICLHDDANMDVKKLTKFFSALGSEARLNIVLELLRDPKCHLDLSKCVNLDVSTVWRHAKRLEDAGIVTMERHGRMVVVKPKNPEKLKHLLKVAEEIIRSEHIRIVEQ